MEQETPTPAAEPAKKTLKDHLNRHQRRYLNKLMLKHEREGRIAQARAVNQSEGEML